QIKNTALIMFMAVALTFSACKSRKAKVETTYNIQVMHTQMPCGGMMPPPEMEEEMNRPTPYANKTIYITAFKGSMEGVLKVTTNKAGIMNVALDSGQYVAYIFDPTVASTANPEGEADEKAECEKQWREMLTAPFKINKAGAQKEIMFMLICNPCEDPKP
ncbi:MAG: hypothetical protein ACI9NN_001423, partial [Bacteroidia bacterium]